MSSGKFAPRRPASAGSSTSSGLPAVSVADSFVGPEIVKMTVNFDAGLRRRLKLRAFAEGRSMRDVVEDAVVAYLEGVE